jgi:tetratricopeptide (TPR) repeat protein
MYHQAGRFQDCIDAAKKALKLKPDYAEAYNNIAAANEALGRWDDAIDAARHALRIDPNLQLAKNNLAWSESQKKLKGH